MQIKPSGPYVSWEYFTAFVYATWLQLLQLRVPEESHVPFRDVINIVNNTLSGVVHAV